MNTFKLLMIILLVVSAVIIAQLVNTPAGKSDVEDRHSILENSLEAFVSEAKSYEDRFVFTYSPRNPDSRFDCYITYEFRENGNTLESIDKGFYGNVSTENPIILEFPRKKDSIYELKATIKDKSGINLYKNETKISPLTAENETIS